MALYVHLVKVTPQGASKILLPVATREPSQSPESPAASPLHDCAEPFQAHQPAAGHCAPGLCPGRSDASARTRPGSDPFTPR